jgi:hypothetical protein
MSDAPPPPDKQRYASGSGPVNRRTALPKSTPPVMHEAIRQKLARNAAQLSLGPPLAHLAVPAAAPKPTKTTIALAVGLALSASGGVLASVQASAAGMAASALSGGVVAAYAWVRRRKSPRLLTSCALDREVLAALDTTLANAAPQLPEATLATLLVLKSTIARVVPLLNTLVPGANFTQDDRHYVIELVRRYVPDSLAAYLHVPAAQRNMAGANGEPSALDLLNGQLALLQTELSSREQLLVQGTHAALQQQDRFLQSKRRIG